MHSFRHSLRVVLASLAVAGGALASADEFKTPGTPSPSSTVPGTVVVLSLDGAVSPATADYLLRGLRTAAERKAALVVIQMDTPGGLDTAMRDIIKAIIASPVPVASFVAPSGARAASAGTYILYASHVAAMAPGTNLGAATPVAIGIPGQPRPPGQADDQKTREPKKAEDAGRDEDKKPAPADAMSAKQVNDAAAYIRGLAQLRGRNADWAELAVREAASLAAEEAVASKVVDLVAQDLPDLLKRIDGRIVSVAGLEQGLKTSPVEIRMLDPDWRSRLLAVIANPGMALILMMIGIYGLIFEFSNPGFFAPGVIGAICLLLAAFAFQLMPINYAGLALILLGIAFVVAEAFMPSFGILGIGGATAMVIGSVMLFDEETSAAYALPTPFVVALGIVSSALVFATVTLALKARRRPVVSGREDLVAAHGVALEDFEGDGWVRVGGERWRACSHSRLHSGQRLRVISLDGLKLTVEPAGEANGKPGGDEK